MQKFGFQIIEMYILDLLIKTGNLSTGIVINHISCIFGDDYRGITSHFLIAKSFCKDSKSRFSGDYICEDQSTYIIL